MTGAQQGWLLLCSHLCDAERRTLSTAQIRELACRTHALTQQDVRREMTAEDLVALGYGRDMAQRIISLLDAQELLRHYCRIAEKNHCTALTRSHERYPQRLLRQLGNEAPGCLWCKGDVSLLDRPMVALVGSRDILQRNRLFAEEVGKQAAQQGYVLLSGNARGADQSAQNACLRHGGYVISVVADALTEKPEKENVLFISELDYDAPFTAQRAISRNRVIHCLAKRTFVAQCGDREGGTWDGTAKNLQHGWSRVFCFDDASAAMRLLEQMGAERIKKPQLRDFESLPGPDVGFLQDI